MSTRCRSFASAINRLVDHIVVWRLLACSGSLPSPVEASAADFDLRFPGGSPQITMDDSDMIGA